jgi:hypothetical protein
MVLIGFLTLLVGIVVAKGSYRRGVQNSAMKFVVFMGILGIIALIISFLDDFGDILPIKIPTMLLAFFSSSIIVSGTAIILTFLIMTSKKQKKYMEVN